MPGSGASPGQHSKCTCASSDSLLERLRQQVAIGMANAARTGDLGSIRQSQTQSKMPPRISSKTPKLSGIPGCTSLSLGSCTVKRPIIPVPPKGDSAAVGRPTFRRKVSYSSSK
eukprot:gnl/MRDRNA2_/MRDRNA2_124698_c0_seq1.p1 gnl/MRDRNA2_/MRDRNA2_124698_c0~~gnl/MRDRNA2_/MRDRNA2_124698_c0_seq1.p1  ORF type:complete len:132 (+),score=23.86 gnl/MRDRNA2_/MRDRNA2_124698_c0_seq1:55-396(+)